MKYITHDWDRKDDGILFFVQRLEEMLFHYSDDIVRAPVHNTATLIKEYILLDNNENIQELHLELVAFELIHSIQNDEIVKNSFGSEFISKIINSIKCNQKETIYYLSGQIQPEKYLKLCVDYLVSCVEDGRKKEEIGFGLRSWIASVMDAGYAAEYIYRYLHNVFDNPMESPQLAVKKFLNHFALELKKYKVYLLFMSTVQKYRDFFEKRLGIVFEDDGNFNKIRKRDNKAFVGIIEVEAQDPYSAVDKAYGRIDIFVRFYRVISNRKKALLGKNALVKNINSDEELFLPVIPLGYNSIEIEPQYDLVDAIDNAIIGCQRKCLDTYEALQRMITLHNMALQQVQLDDGFVNLWSILEVVSKDADGKSKIEKVIKSILPILQNDFFAKYFQSLNHDLKCALSRADYHELIKSISEEGNEEYKIACFSLLEKYEKQRENYFAILKQFPNIRQRVYKIYCLRKDKRKLYDLSENYAQRLKWHIYRLYRVRNGIVHAGEQHKYVQILGEHLHIYCDSIILELIGKLSETDELLSIQDVLVDTKLLTSMKREYFGRNEEIVEEDIQVLFLEYFMEENRCPTT